MGSIDSKTDYLRKATEARWAAEKAKGHDARATLLGIAQQWERLAKTMPRDDQANAKQSGD